ncbi:MAG: STT3 domain-containing protein [Candidatus Pacearchaeota archaeon]|jgi:asparagine N-glycosylation enzyme membrane subunit Stt3|nr:STT3 domain-containing protein [Candidatus Pacearchaeota archaeon]|tara:strand:+ start:526 stop:3306 length:2781 start_codon:yes stop_codon:yes gene_type:complete
MEKEDISNETSKNELEKRKEKLADFLKQKKDWAYYLILSFIVYIGFYIRTRNIPRLKDITTGTWTLGPDLDPFLFLRWAEHIVENGSLMIWDNIRYIPLGYNTAGEMKLLAYMIAWFHNFLSIFSKEITVTYSAILFPAVMFALTTIAFFLFARIIFYKENKKTRNIIALIATSFFVLIPSLLPRTIAGIPEKESAAFFFMFIAFYFFMKAFTSNNLRKGMIFGILAGISTAGMALIWGGVLFIFFTISTSVLLAFILGKIKKNELIIYATWMITSFIVMMPFSTRYILKNLVMSISTGSAISVFVIISLSLLIMKTNKLEKIRKKTKLPDELSSVIISIFILILIVSISLGPSFIFEQVHNVKSSLIQPIENRFSLTVAENKQPYFLNDWRNNFGPIVFNIPLFFWLFFIGSVLLFNNMIKKLKKKEKIILTSSYLIFLICLIFSRYASGHILNGTSRFSLLVYFGGWLFFLGTFGYFYYKIYNDGDFSLFKAFNFNYILYSLILTLGIIGARGGIRLIMVLGAVSPVVIGFLIVKISKKYFEEKDEAMKLFVGITAVLILIAAVLILIGNPLLMLKGDSFWGWGGYFQQDKITADYFAPGPYQWQWQKAMSWVRNNTSEEAVFAHWWDYGYWLQSIGKRSTILDGGNAIAYWNHLMGRHVLTGDDENKALEFLYTHNGTHLLIDSTEIGKYTAFSSIGSDEDYDRISWITVFLMDEKQTQETKNETIYVYTGGTLLDEDIIWEQDGKEIFLPKRRAGVGAIILKRDKDEKITKVEAIFVDNGRQYRIPLRFAYFDNELHDFKEGLDAGVFLFPRLDALSGGRTSLNEIGASMYLSRRTIHSQLASLYLFDQKTDYFNLVHTENSLVIEDILKQGFDIGDFVYYQGFQGPIKIWEIKYPSYIKLNPAYLETDYPEKLQELKQGEY